MRHARPVASASCLAVLGGIIFWLAPGCSAKGDGGSGFTNPDEAGTGGDADAGVDAGAPIDLIGDASLDSNRCRGLSCQQVACGNGATTSISGTIYDPAGKNPLYNVIVYVPNAPVAKFPPPVICDKCGTPVSGAPLVATLTDAAGHFKIDNAPVGDDIPLVIQVGKWRRQIKIPRVAKCVDTAITDKDVSRLPRNSKEGDMPQMALTTGGCELTECLLRKIGVDDAEFTAPSGSGKVHLYTGTGGGGAVGSPEAQALWSEQKTLGAYDVVLLACECRPHAETKPQQALDALHAYVNAGGRVFASHYHYYWFNSGQSDFQSIASWTPDTLGNVPPTYSVDDSFPKGKAFADWLVNVGASTTKGIVPLKQVADDVATVNAPSSQRWIYQPSGGDGGNTESDKFFTFNTPIGKGPDNLCGRVSYTDLHVTVDLGADVPGQVFPTGCHTTELTPQEKALEFLLFDLTSCVQLDSDPPKPPPLN